MPNLPTADRRRFITLSAAILGTTVSGSVNAAEPKSLYPTAIISPTGGAGICRVRMEMEMEGNVNVATNPLVSREIDLQLPLASDAVFDYEERPQFFRRESGSGDGSTPNKYMVAARFYHEAGSDSRLNKSITQRRIRSSARSTIIDRRDLPETIYCRDEYLTREEVDLLRCPISSLTIDTLLPIGEVAVGQTHHPSLTAIGEALNLTSVQTSDVQLTVKSIEDKIVKFEMSGEVVGTASGVPTKIKTIGKLSYDRDTEMVGWVAMAIHETRDIGVSEPGFDLQATMKMVRQPWAKPVGLSAKPDPQLADRRIREARTIALLESDTLNLSAMMDRRWQTMADVPGAAVWRMTQNDRSVAQCDLRSLASLSAGQSWTLDNFIAEIRKTLGDQLQSIVHQAKTTSPAGLEVLSVTATGSAGGVEVRWTMLHFNAPATSKDDELVAGRRILATFTMQGDQVDEFAGSDEQLAATLQIGTTADAEAVGTSNPEPKIPSGLDKSPRRSASLPSRKPSRRVNSASDISSSDLR